MIKTGRFSFPTRIEFGAGKLRELPQILENLVARRPLVVTDPGLVSTPAFGALRETMGKGIALFSGVHANPVEADVEEARKAYLDGDCDGVIGFGGGSALDVAKIVRSRIAHSEASLADFYAVKEWPKLAPFVAIPTTAGTGSEVGRSSVISFGGRKQVLFHPTLLADVVILDPELTVGLPAGLTAATGFDALTHCIESFTSPVFHPFCDAIALEGARLCHEYLPRAVKDGKDIEARGQMQVAAAMGGVAFQKDLGAVHSMAHPLSTLYGMHHGLTNALCLVAVMRFNTKRKAGVYNRFAWALGLAAQDDATVIGAVEKLLKTCGIDGGLAQRGVKAVDIARLSEAAMEDTCHKTNPVPVTREDFVKLYEESL